MSESNIEKDMEKREIIPNLKYVEKIYRRYPLIGNYIIKDETLSKINIKAKEAIDVIANNPERHLTTLGNLYVTLATINYAKSWDSSDEGKFTRFICMQFGYRDDSGRIWGIISSCIQTAMRSQNRFFIVDSTGRQFVETVLVHCLGPQNAWDSVFDLLFDFLKNNLRWEYIKGDPSIRTMVEVLKRRFDGNKNDDDELVISANQYYIRLGARRLIQYRPVYAAAFLDEIINRIYNLVNGQQKEPANFIDYQVDDWYAKKLTRMISSERKQVTSTHRRSSNTALSYSKIRPLYKLINSSLILETPTIRLEDTEISTAEEQIILGEDVYRSIRLEVFGNELGKTISGQEISLKGLGSRPLEIAVSITCNNNIIYTSGRSLIRKFLAFKNGKEVSPSSLNIGSYQFYLPDLNSFVFENARIRQLDDRVYDVELMSDFSIRLNGRIIAMDTTNIDQIKFIEPATLTGAYYFVNGEWYEIANPADNIHVYLDTPDRKKTIRVFYNQNPAQARGYIEDASDPFQIDIPLTVSNTIDDTVEVTVVDGETEEVLFKHDYFLNNAFSFSFNRDYYFQAEDYENAEIIVNQGDEKKIFNFNEGDSEISLPYKFGEIKIIIPCVRITMHGIETRSNKKAIWHEDINPDSYLEVQNDANLDIKVEIFGQKITNERIGLSKYVATDSKKRAYNQTINVIINGRTFPYLDIIFSDMFVNNPVFLFSDDCLTWDGGINYLGNSSSEFALLLYREGILSYRFPLLFGKTEIASCPDFIDGDYTYQIIRITDSEEIIVAQDTQFIGNLSRIRFNGKIIEIERVTEDVNDGGQSLRIKPVYIDGIKFVSHSFVPSEDGIYDIYEGTMYFVRQDGSKKYFSSIYYSYKNANFYQVNPVKIIYINEQFLRIVNADEEGLYCYHNFGTSPSMEITDREPPLRAKNYKDVLFYLYETLNISVVQSHRIIEQAISKSENTGMFSRFEIVKQEDIITAEVDERIVVNAGPGTGKTYTLIQRIINLVNVQDIDPQDILVLCFSRAAVEVIRNRLNEAYLCGLVDETIHYVDVRTFDSFASQVLYWVQDSESTLLDSYVIGALNYDERISLFCIVITKCSELISQCAHLFVDEVQDLVKVRAHMILDMIRALPADCGITLLGDSCQSIYDYQATDDPMTSSQFYKVLIERIDGFKYYSLGRNYRQDDQLAIIGDEYRNSILSGNSRLCDGKWKTYVNSAIEDFTERDIYKITKEQLEGLLSEGTVGILTRTNGQALKISASLREKGIKHTIKRRLQEAAFSAWIAQAFNKCDSLSLDYDDFIDLLPATVRSQSNRIWDDIVDCMGGVTGRIDIRRLLRQIIMNARGSTLFIQEKQEPITITNIHRGKGREFDTVLVEDGIFSEDQKTLEEHKVSYVAITRPKAAIYKIHVNSQYMSIDKAGDRRCYQASFGRSGKRYLTNFEVGAVYDIDHHSLAYNERTQNYLQQESDELVGKEVTLIRDSENTEFVSYSIYCTELDLFLGKTSKDFAGALERALRDIYKLPNHARLYFNVYPTRMSKIYIDDVISIVDEADGNEKGINTFGEMACWNSILMMGYAVVEYR